MNGSPDVRGTADRQYCDECDTRIDSLNDLTDDGFCAHCGEGEAVPEEDHPRLDSDNKADDAILLPSDVVSWHGETAGDIARYLREQGIVNDHESVRGLTIEIAVEESVRVTDIETVDVEADSR